MPKRYFTIDLPDGAEIHVLFETASGLIINFVVKLLLKMNGKYYEVIRFDSGHNCPHKDVLDIHGNIIRKIWFDFLDNKQGLNLAIKDLKDNHDLYLERFKKWLEK